MKCRIFTSVMMLFAIGLMVNAQSFERQWDQSNATGLKPDFVTGFTNRGIAATPEYLFLASRSLELNAEGKAVIYLDAKTGEPAGQLDVSPVVVGQFAVNDVEVSDDGQILASNLALPPQEDPFRSWQFKMYKWTDIAAVPTVFIDYDNPQNLRIGDMITVKGDLTANAIIYASVHGAAKVVRWEVVAGVLNTTPEIIELPGITETGGALNFPKVIPTGVSKNDPFYHNATGTTLKKFSADGTTILEEIVPANFLPSNGVVGKDNSITDFMVDGQHYIGALGMQGTAANSPAEIKAIDVTNGLDAAIDPFHSESLGTANNTQLNGDIASTVIDGEVWVFLLYSQSGFAAHKFVAPLPEVVVPVTEDGWRRGSNPTLDEIDGRMSKPDWLNATSRAVAVGNGHIYVVNCAEGGPGEIRVLDATNGSYLKKKLKVGLLNNSPTAGNKIRIADIEVDDAGHILACNMRMGEPLYIYAWDTEDSEPYILAQAAGMPYAEEGEGDKIWQQTSYYFDVKGDIKGDAVIVAARSNLAITYRWVITGGVVQNEGKPIVTTNVFSGGVAFGTYAAAALESADPESPIWVSAGGLHPTRFLADGTFKGTIPDVVAAPPTGYSSEITRSAKYFEWEGKKYLLVYVWSWAAKPRLIDVSAEDLSTLTVGDHVTLAGDYLGQEPVDLVWGDVDYFIGEDGSLNLITLDANNGIMLKRIPATPVSVGEIAKDQLSIYPNPTSNMLYVSHPAGVSKVEIINVTGALVKSLNNVSAEGINVSGLNTGVYFVQVTTNDKTVVVSKFMKK